MLQLSVASDLKEVVWTARFAFSKRSWPYVMAIAIPWLLCSGQRSMTRLAALASHRRSLSSYYRFLSDGKVRTRVLFECLFRLIVTTFRLDLVTIVLDDTLCPKWGRGIFGAASYFDHSSRPRAGFIWGHNWVVLAVVVPLGAQAWVALPFWIALYRPEKTCKPGEFLTRHQIAVQALWHVRCWFSGPIRLLADGAYANKSLVGPLATMDVHIVSRLRRDARLRRLTAPSRAPGARGRKPKHGAPLPKLGKMASTSSAFRLHGVAIYGKSIELEVRTFDAWWPAIGRAIRVVITRDPRNHKRVAFLWTTDLKLTPIEIIEAFAGRWTIEQMFSVAKNQLGLDSAEVRKERSVLRHAAITMALITWIEVWAHRTHASKRATSFTARLNLLRAETITQTIFASGPRSKGLHRIAGNMAAVFTVATQAA